MRKNFKWYVLLTLSSVFLIGYLSYKAYSTLTFRDPKEEFRREFTTEEAYNTYPITSDNLLPIPPLLEDQNPEEGKAEFHLEAQHGKMEFVEGYETNTLGYNGDYLGPVIRVKRGDEVKIKVQNQLESSTTVHWHGLEVTGEMDGGPHQGIAPNSSWIPEFTIDQAAATLWYHPHLLNLTGEQVYKGLAGLFYIEDKYSESLDIPKEYGVNDIPLIVQDKRITDDGQIPYNLSMADQMNGFMGNTVLINGAISPQLEVKNEVIRLRILNGSNARSYNFNFTDGTEFYQIASDGGFLEESIRMDQLQLAAAERVEILLDLTEYALGDQLYFRDGNNNLMSIKITEESDEEGNIPEKLVEIDEYNREEVIRTREFVMSGAGPMVAINGKQMDMDRIDEYLALDELEEWVVKNETNGMDMDGGRMTGGMMGMMSSPHPFHVHGVQFQIIERNGQEPAPNERGWKDTVMLEEGEEVRLLVKFRKEGLFMYHCHILEHEDAGMMGQFLVE